LLHTLVLLVIANGIFILTIIGCLVMLGSLR
jgi:hypothetical protein